MFKRRDWVYTHNPDTGDVTSDSDTDGGSDATSDEGTSDAASVGDGHDEPVQLSDGGSDGGSDEEVIHPMRMEELQEILASDDSDGDGEGIDTIVAAADAAPSKVVVSQQGDPAAVEKQKAEWLQAPEGTSVKGIPLRCLLCKDKLLMNSCGFQGHMKSKAHLAAAKRHGVLDDPLEQLDSIVAAVTCRHETEETETHKERVERFQQIAEDLKRRRNTQVSKQLPHKHKNKKKPNHTSCHEDNQEGSKSGTQEELQTAGLDRTNKRKKSGRNRPEKPKRKKPGRRQRLEAKAAAAAAAK